MGKRTVKWEICPDGLGYYPVAGRRGVADQVVRSCGRLAVRSGRGTSKLLRRPRTIFPSLLRTGAVASGDGRRENGTMPGSVRQSTSLARTRQQGSDRSFGERAERRGWRKSWISALAGMTCWYGGWRRTIRAKTVRISSPIGVGKGFPSPPSEPCVRFSRTRLSSRPFPHRDWQAKTWASFMVKSPNLGGVKYFV
jgi:hypothetical protein